MNPIPPQQDSAGALTRIPHGSFTHQPGETYQETIENGEDLSQKSTKQIRQRQSDTIERLHKMLLKQSKQVDDSMTYAENYMPDPSDRIDIMAAIKLREAAAKAMAMLMLNYKEVFAVETEVYQLNAPDNSEKEKNKAELQGTLSGIDDRLKRLAEAKSEFSDMAKNIFEARPIMVEANQ